MSVAPTLTVVGRTIKLPRTRAGRALLGWAFVAGGCLSVLPILGPWMFPVGFYILSVDSAPMRRRRRRVTIWIGRKWPRALNVMITGDRTRRRV